MPGWDVVCEAFDGAESDAEPADQWQGLVDALPEDSPVGVASDGWAAVLAGLGDNADEDEEPQAVQVAEIEPLGNVNTRTLARNETGEGASEPNVHGHGLPGLLTRAPSSLELVQSVVKSVGCLCSRALGRSTCGQHGEATSSEAVLVEDLEDFDSDDRQAQVAETDLPTPMVVDISQGLGQDAGVDGGAEQSQQEDCHALCTAMERMVVVFGRWRAPRLVQLDAPAVKMAKSWLSAEPTRVASAEAEAGAFGVSAWLVRKNKQTIANACWQLCVSDSARVVQQLTTDLVASGARCVLWTELLAADETSLPLSPRHRDAHSKRRAQYG